MNRYAVLFIIFLMSALFCYAQEFPSYGKVTSDELKLKECSFDKEATAVVMLDEAVSNYNDQNNLITNRHVRIKILKDKGIDYANISIPFYRANEFEFINNVEGLTINTDNNGNAVIQTLEKKSIFTKNTSERIGEVRFTFPSVKAGSIIEYRYQSTMKHYGGLEDWSFQKDIPVVQSKYVLYILPSYEFTYQVFKNNSFDIKIEPDTRDGRVLFEMKNIPGLEDEPYMDARRDYIQRVAFQLSGYGTGNFDKKKYMTSWDELTKELLNSSNLGVQLSKDLTGTDDFLKLAKLNTSQIEKMTLIYNYVRSNMVWNGYNSKYSTDGVKAAWNKKKGTSGDLNLILINLLKEADLETYPMLVSERYHGKVNTQYPFVDQFNTVYAAVFIDGKKYYLDATDKFTPSHIIPYNILNTTALILNKKVGGLVNITDESLQYRDIITVIAMITPDETIKGNVFVNSMDYARIRRLERYSNNSSKYIDEVFKQSRTSVNIDSFNVLNEENDSLSLQHKFIFVTPLDGTGDYKFIPLNLFSGFERNPFISDKRFSDINFGYKRTISVNTFISLPPGYLIDALPKSIQLVNPDKSVVFSREIFRDDASNKIMCRIKMDFKKSHYTADEYDDIKEFYKKMFEMLNEQIVLKKKT
ncbi:MAG: DUF3857 domain-containing protein [Chitinophagaceae bacterium]|nr:DUF3857 domain-containing protein [Chitinophagaceae bacterium]